MNTIDLTQRPPRSPRVPLGGYVILPRMLEKGRAQLAGKAGDYHFRFRDSGLDSQTWEAIRFRDCTLEPVPAPTLPLG